MAAPTIPMTFQQIVKSPYSYLLITVVSLLWFFVYSFTGLAKTNDADCAAEKVELRIELKAERTKNDNLVNSILVKQGVIDKLTTITDSLNNDNKEITNVK
jgi:hypothetical protein